MHAIQASARFGIFATALLALSALACLPAAAQAPAPGAPGQVRVQGEQVTPPAGLRPPVLGKLTNYRDEMRRLVTNIGRYARSKNPAFVIMTHNGMELLEKHDDVDDRKVFPARAYMLSIDAILQDGLFYGFETFGQPTSKDQKEIFAHLEEVASRNRVSLLTMDFAKDPKKVDEVLRTSSKKGYLPFVAHKELSILNSMPPYPSRPYRENPNHILSMSAAQNYLYLRETAAFGTEQEFALQIHDTNYDMVILDVFHGRKPFSKRAIETMKYKKLGARRLVIARMDVGTAATYRFYWKAGWQSGSPRWITAPYPTDPDRYFVEYWRPEWHKIMYGNPQSFAFGLIAQGYDGVLIETTEAYRYFESDGQEMASFK
jgi:endo-alpha-1,4-polygalactosaminidase (GH114 family)